MFKQSKTLFMMNWENLSETAMEKLNGWFTNFPELYEAYMVKETFAKRKEHIINYWRYRQTNAYTESVNNAIKKIEKAGRGYSFDNLRERCILSINNPAPDKFDFKKAVYIKKGAPVMRKKVDSLYNLAFNVEHFMPKHLPAGFDEPLSNLIVMPQNTHKMIEYIQRVGRSNRLEHV